MLFGFSIKNLNNKNHLHLNRQILNDFISINALQAIILKKNITYRRLYFQDTVQYSKFRLKHNKSGGFAYMSLI